MKRMIIITMLIMLFSCEKDNIEPINKNKVKITINYQQSGDWIKIEDQENISHYLRSSSTGRFSTMVDKLEQAYIPYWTIQRIGENSITIEANTMLIVTGSPNVIAEYQ